MGAPRTCSRWPICFVHPSFDPLCLISATGSGMPMWKQHISKGGFPEYLCGRILISFRKQTNCAMRVPRIPGVRSVHLLLLALTSGLGGVADSTMSPYFCPLARSPIAASKHNFVSTCCLLRKCGFGSDICGHIISIGFCTQVSWFLKFFSCIRPYLVCSDNL